MRPAERQCVIVPFHSLNILPSCLKLLQTQNITTPTPIQEQAIPVALEGRDLVAVAQTGTGKTLAFGLPGLTRLATSADPRAQMLVLCPTRELAVQIHSVLDPFARQLHKRTVCLYGGVNINPQVAKLHLKPSVIIATPGRLLDHIARRSVSFQNLQMLVLDEADRMLDMGFLPDIKRILAVLPAGRQTLLFSATFPPETRSRVLPMLREPHHIEIKPESTPVETIDQGVYTVGQTDKAGLLVKLLANPDVRSTLVFTRTKHRADKVTKLLRNNGLLAVTIHGDRTQGQRQEALEHFRGGKSNILVATDIAARGIDVKGITHVINYDIPVSSEDYIHRIGRTARARMTGVALTFASPGDEAALRGIEKKIGRKLGRHVWEGEIPLAEQGCGAANVNAARPRSHGGSSPRRSSKKPGRQNDGNRSAKPSAKNFRAPVTHTGQRHSSMSGA